MYDLPIFILLFYVWDNYTPFSLIRMHIMPIMWNYGLSLGRCRRSAGCLCACPGTCTATPRDAASATAPPTAAPPSQRRWRSNRRDAPCPCCTATTTHTSPCASPPSARTTTPSPQSEQIPLHDASKLYLNVDRRLSSNGLTGLPGRRKEMLT